MGPVAMVALIIAQEGPWHRAQVVAAAERPPSLCVEARL